MTFGIGIFFILGKKVLGKKKQKKTGKNGKISQKNAYSSYDTFLTKFIKTELVVSHIWAYRGFDVGRRLVVNRFRLI